MVAKKNNYLVAILIIITLVVIAGMAVSRGQGLLGGNLFELDQTPIINSSVNN